MTPNVQKDFARLSAALDQKVKKSRELSQKLAAHNTELRMHLDVMMSFMVHHNMATVYESKRYLGLDKIEEFPKAFQ